MAAPLRAIINNLADNPPFPKRLNFNKILVNIHNYSIAVRMYDYIVYQIAYSLEDQESSPPTRTPVSYIFMSAPRLSDSDLAGKTPTDVENMWRTKFNESLRNEFSSVVNVYRMNKGLIRV